MSHEIVSATTEESRSGQVLDRGDGGLELRIRPISVSALFLWLTATLVAIHTFFMVLRYQFGMDHVLGVASVFDLWGEKSVPTWYSSMTLFLCGLLLSLIAWAAWRSRRGDVRYWVGLAVLFMFVSVDESIALHERLMIPVREAKMFTGPFLFVWVIPYGIAMLVLAAVYARFLWRLPSETRILFFLAATIFLAGAVGMEMVGGIVYEKGKFERTIPIDICNGLEESLEMLGVAVFLYALTGYLANQFRNLRVSFAHEAVADDR